MRAYLVVMGESEDARAALRFAAHAARSGNPVEILAIIPPAEFLQWGGVQAAMEEEAKLRAEAMVLEASGKIFERAGVLPSIQVRQGDPVKIVGEVLKERDDLAGLVVSGAAEHSSGDLAAHLGGPAAGTLPCPLIIVPAGYRDEADEA